MRVLILSQEHTESYCKQGLFGLAPVCSQAVSNSFSDLELKTTVEELKLLKLVAMDVNVVLFFPFFFFLKLTKVSAVAYILGSILLNLYSSICFFSFKCSCANIHFCIKTFLLLQHNHYTTEQNNNAVWRRTRTL